jgi:IS30 family transposase
LKKYSRVSYETRCQIFALLKTQTTISTISEILGYHKSTIYRELKRNKGCQNYFPERAQWFNARRAKKRIRKPIIQGTLKRAVVTKLQKGWSPEIIVGRLKKDKIAVMSHETVYRFLEKNPEYATR